MSTVAPQPASPMLDGQPKGLHIGGGSVPAAGGETFASINPATGELVALLADGGAEDIDRAVAAARAAFEGPWSRFGPHERQRVLIRLAELVFARADDAEWLAQRVTLERRPTGVLDRLAANHPRLRRVPAQDIGGSGRHESHAADGRAHLQRVQ